MKMSLILFGIATIYAGIYVGEPLYCDCNGTLFYAPETEPWIALDVLLYQDGWARCGDDILLITGGGKRRVYKAYDAGPLYKYHIKDHPGLPIIGDIPAFLSPFEGLSSKVILINLTRVREAYVK